MRKQLVCAAVSALWLQTLYAQPVITENPRSIAVAEGRRATFAVQAQSGSTLRYQWQFNGVDIPRAVRSSFSTTATRSRAGNFTVVVSDDLGAVRSAVAKLEVQKRPIILAQPRAQIVGEHQTAVFDVRINDSGAYSYVNWWHHSPLEPYHEIPAGAVPTARQFHMEIPDCADNDTYNGLYWIVVTNHVGWTISRRVNLTVVGPPRLSAEPLDRNVRQGASASFSVSIIRDAGPAPTYQWHRNGRPIPGATQRSLRVSRVRPESAGFFHCVVTGIGGATTSTAGQLTVY